MIYLSTAYFGNIRYFSKFVSGESVCLEREEHFCKQSYRSRMDILGANGPLTLSVPVVRRHGEKTKIRDTEIDYAEPWQHVHWNALVSAYRSSPYFVHYEERLAPLFAKKERFLIDLNDRVLERLLELTGIEASWQGSECYLPAGELGPGDRDFRTSISPKARLRRPDPEYREVPYYQVFSDRFGFVPDLSVVDLLCCEGPGTKDILKASCLSSIR